MDMEKWSLRVGAGALACALLVRLGAGGVFSAAARALAAPEAMTVMMFLESGRVVRVAPEEMPQSAPPPQLPQLTQQPTEPEEPAQAVFNADDAALVEVNSACGLDADVPALMLQPLSWDLTQNAPTVLILHSHGTESYEKTEDYEESSPYRTLDTDYNMVSVGAELARVLEEGGVRVIHDRTLHDHPSYSDSYSQSRKSAQSYLAQYPSICLVVDLHRDAVESGGRQIAVTAQKDGVSAAQLMLVVGTDVRLKHPQWPENMSLAVKLHARLEKNFPGICRPISFRSQRFNQDLSPGALLVEVGSAGNTRQEALCAARVLGQTILELKNGAATQQ